ncbi:isopeptide-forming domain-containing fimbrial protein [Paenibacillus lautus]|uniref:isopeptide-forming domain-containing fimbrial protein n=1 Tax=Paenibacillus lautus TaxID=1401 RepID=UPI002DB7586E|nr:isopeptide-forming domain-containing fimbrial protein [Paenibacillus lautus]MEC0203994.1 isopeptide-forming domain-containing fimbrial protein [Paenibacillus lautus]
MKRKPIINRRFKYLMAVFIILFGQILSLYPQNAEAATGKWLNFKYDGFPEDTFKQSFTVNGAAQVPPGENFIRLTPETTQQSGSVFNNTALCLRDNYSFSTAFSFKMSNPSPQGPSDGLTFTIQAGKTSQHAEGGGLGYYGINPSFAVKYDTFKNDVYSDPSANYIGLAVNGTVTNDQAGWFTDLGPYNTANNTNYVLSNGTLYYTWIEYNGSAQNVQVRLGTSPDRASSQVILDVNDIDLNTIFGGQSFYAGFTGSTGFPNYETHDIHSWYFVNEYAPIETLNPKNDYELNQPPTVPGDSKITAVSTPVSGQVNGTDPDGDPLTYAKGTDPGNGTVTVNADGTWTYTPTQAFIGQDSFTVIANDGKCAKTEATINVEVSDSVPSTNQPPVVSDDRVTTEKDTPVSGVVDATDRDGDTLEYSKGQDPTNGNVTVDPDGSWTYTPDPDFVGEDSFTVIVDDGNGGKTEVVIIVDVTDPNTPPNACGVRVALINGSFEEPPGEGSNGTFAYSADEVPGWKTTDTWIEIWDYAAGYPAPYVQQHVPPVEGNRYAEINAAVNGMLYQDVKTTPGQTIYWRLSHIGLSGIDTMQLRIGPATTNPYDTSIVQQMSDDNAAWGTYTGSYTVPAGQMMTRFGFEAVSTSTGSIGHGNHLDDIFLGTGPCVTANKTASPQEVNAGDEVTYEIQIKNEGGDIAANTSVTDLIPEGTEYVPGSMKLIQGSTTKDLTDKADTDEGHFDGSKVSIQLGDLANTNQLADGVTVQLKVKVLSSAANQQIKNKAQISYGNLLTGDTEQKESNETTTPVRFNPPVLESNKTAVLQTKAAGNTDPDHPEPGDTLRYSIQARNTVDNSFVSSLVISDDLPAGLQYVPGSLKVDGVSVTDDEGDQDGGFYTDGQVIGLLGDITDTKWHTLEFDVIIATGQAGKDIRNTAVVGGENVSTPSNAEEVVQVYPRHPVVDSEKIAENLDTGKTNFEVGDTIVYTIRTRTVTDDAYISNLKITDTLPAGLEYVPGSLKVNGKTATDAEGDDEGHVVTGSVYGGFGDIWDKEWQELQFHATIQTGQAGKDIRNIADVSGDNFDEPSLPEEEVQVYPRNPVVVSEKSATNLAGKDTFEVGDTAIYSIRTRTVIGDTYMANLVITDTLPAGLEYIPGSLKVDGVSVTDDKDSDKGHYASGQVVGHVGDVWDTKWHTLEFRAKIVANAGESIRNTGEITGDNIDQPSRPTDEIVVENGGTPPVDPPVDPPIDPPVNPPVDPNPPVTPPVTPPTTPSPVIESRKTSQDLNGGSTAVGDTMEYTISARNTVSGSYVSNLVIADILPEGLAYVAGSLKVDGVSVTDNADGDKGQYVNGKVSGNFGRIADTEWHTIEFKATVKAGQAGNAIENIGEVTGDNVTSPEKPSNVIEVTDNENHNGNNPNPGGTGDSDGDSNEDPNGNSNEGSNEDSNEGSNEDTNGDSDGDSNTGSQTPDDHNDSTLGVSDSTPQDPAESGDQATNAPEGNKLPNTATNMYSYMVAGAIMLLAGLLLLRRRKKA